MKDFLNWLSGMSAGSSQFVKNLEEGREEMLFSLVQDGILPLEIAAQKTGMLVTDFEKAMTEAGYSIPG